MIGKHTILFYLTFSILVLQKSYAEAQITASSPISAPTTSNLRGGETEQRSLDDDADDSVFCRITMFDTMYVSEDGEPESSEQVTCIPIVDEVESDFDFPIDFPLDFLEMHKEDIEQGKLLVSISDAQLVGDGLEIGSNPQFTVVTDRRFRHLQERHLEIKDTMTVAVIRISTTDATPRDSAATVKGNLFGDGINFQTQYDACSFGKLKWILAPTGVLDIQLPNNVTEFAGRPGALVYEAQQFLKSHLNVLQVSGLADKVIMCVPPGTGDWAASAGVNHWRAQMNSNWCSSLSGTMHEVGHTLGLLHSNSNGMAYNDRSGYMGGGYTASKWPQKCFNGYHSWRFGWYSDRHLTINPLTDGDQLIKLATFVDFNRAAVDEPVVVNIVDKLYLQYNVAKDFNIHTEQKQNQVTITEPGSKGTESLAGLRAGYKYTVSNFRFSGKTLIVEACETMDGALGSDVDVILISVSMGESLCGTEPDPASVVLPSTAPGRTPFLSWLYDFIASLRESI